MKRQICSYDMVAVPSNSYTVTDAEGEMYLCNSRCLCIWAVMLVTKHNLPESERDRSVVVTNPVGKKLSFDKLMALSPRQQLAGGRIAAISPQEAINHRLRQAQLLANLSDFFGSSAVGDQSLHRSGSLT